MLGAMGGVEPGLGGTDELTLGFMGFGTLLWEGADWLLLLRPAQGIGVGQGWDMQASCCSISLRPVSVCG